MAMLGTWANRLVLTIDSSKVDATLPDFPVTIQLGSSVGISSFDATAVFDELTSDANRKKIAVTTSDGTTQCYVEIEKWDDANETAVLHVKVPSVSSSADTVLYLYYDSTQADNTTYVGDTTDAVTHNVWDSNFVAVYHMAQDPNGDVADAIKDSTSNANDGTPSGSMTTADLVDAKVGKGIDFDGVDDYISVSSATAFDLGTQDFTAEAIIKSSSTDNYSRIVSLGFPVCIPIRLISGKISTYINSAAYNMGGSSQIDGSDHHICLIADRDGNATSYSNSVSQATSDISANSGYSIDSTGLGIAAEPNGTDSFTGIIDEVRISSIARSASWIKATYNSLWDSLITLSEGSSSSSSSSRSSSSSSSSRSSSSSSSSSRSSSSSSSRSSVSSSSSSRSSSSKSSSSSSLSSSSSRYSIPPGFGPNVTILYNNSQNNVPNTGSDDGDSNWKILDTVNDKIAFLNSSMQDGNARTYKEPFKIPENGSREIPKQFVNSYRDGVWKRVYLAGSNADLGGGGNYRYAYGAYIDGTTTSAPVLQAWDSTSFSSYNLAVLGSGTPANSMLRAITTTNSNPGDSWAGTPLAGENGSYSIALDSGPITNSKMAYWNMRLLVPSTTEPFSSSPVMCIYLTYS